MNFKSLIIVFTCLLLLVGCSSQSETKERAVSKTVEETKENRENIPSAARTLEEMVNQKAGILMEEHFEEDLEDITGWNGDHYQKFYDQTFRPIAEKELKEYFSKHKNASSEEVYDYLVYQLGSGLYKQYYEQLQNYDHGFAMPELPDGPDTVEKQKKKTNILVLIDASGSMKGKVNGGVKMDLAKDAIRTFLSQLPDATNVSLMAYGHVGTGDDGDKAKSCSAIDTVYPLDSYNADSFGKALDSFKASGWTPLAGAIEKANATLASYHNEEYNNIVYIVSDGIETCDGNPVEAAKKLQESNIQAQVNIIGFDVDDQGQQQLKSVADAGKGTYMTVRDQAELEEVVLKKWKPSIGQLVWTVGVSLPQLIDAKERLNEIYNPLYSISDREFHRIRNAAYFLNNEKLISDEVEKEILQLAEGMKEVRGVPFQQLKEQKYEKLEQDKKEIDSKVEEWKAQWKE